MLPTERGSVPAIAEGSDPIVAGQHENSTHLLLLQDLARDHTPSRHDDVRYPLSLRIRRNQIALNLIGADGSPTLIWAEDMKATDLQRAVQLVRDQQELFLAKWREIHG